MRLDVVDRFFAAVVASILGACSIGLTFLQVGAPLGAISPLTMVAASAGGGLLGLLAAAWRIRTHTTGTTPPFLHRIWWKFPWEWALSVAPVAIICFTLGVVEGMMFLMIFTVAVLYAYGTLEPERTKKQTGE